MIRESELKYWLAGFFGVETFCITYGLNAQPLVPLFSFVYFFSGVAIAVLMLRFPDSVVLAPKTIFRQKYSLVQGILFFAALAALMFSLSRYWLKAVPVDVYTADMLPIMKVMDQRFIAGQWKHVYDTIPEIWQGIRPIYLPAMWMPFSIPTLLHIDVRWLTVVCLLFAYTSFFHILHFRRHEVFAVFLSFFAAMLFWWLMTQNDMHGFISVSEEGIVAAYYVFLILSLLSGNIWLTAIAASLCLLSRYSLVGWVPAFGVYLVFSKRFKDLLIFAATGLTMLFVLFILPFGWDPFLRLIHLPEYYIDFAERVWKASPEVFANSMGFAKFFGPEGTTVIHHLLVLLAFLVPLLFMGCCLYLKRKGKNLNNIPLATLKLSLVVFYSFLDVPYLYLFYTSSFVSLLSVCFFVAGHHENEPE